jgi:hypothetical protein
MTVFAESVAGFAQSTLERGHKAEQTGRASRGGATRLPTSPLLRTGGKRLGYHAAQNQHQFPLSITSSARASSDRGTVRPSAFAVFRLITSSNLVGCLHRKIGRPRAFEDLGDIAGSEPRVLEEVGPVAQQAAPCDETSLALPNRRQPVCDGKVANPRSFGTRQHEPPPLVAWARQLPPSAGERESNPKNRSPA